MASRPTAGVAALGWPLKWPQTGGEEKTLNLVLLYVGSALPVLWGLSHLFPTKSTVVGFGEISLDNRRIITMEWIVEGVALIFIGTLAASVTYVESTSPVSTVVYWPCFAMLNTLSIVSLFTGFKISFLPFKLCPLMFTTSSILLILGRYL
jgi:hypothetical protein